MFRRHGPLALVLSVCVAAFSAVPVLAAAPGNDDIGTPTVVGAIPYSNSQATEEATTGPTDPDCSGTGPTVWYEYTAAEAGRLEVNTFGSNYDTTLSVGTPDGAGGVVLIACNDDAGGDLQSRVRFDAEEGATYLFMVGAFGGRAGGTLVFNLDVAPPVVPLELSLSLNSSGRFDRNGMATISGVLTCSGAEFAELYGYLSQEIGRFRVSSDGWAFVDCSPDGAPFQMEFWGQSGKFAGGPASAYLEAFTCGEDDCALDVVEATVRLRK